MTLAQAKAACKAVGMSLRKRDGEYRVTLRNVDPQLAERIAYYTNDISDAVATAVAMSREPGMADYV